MSDTPHGNGMDPPEPGKGRRSRPVRLGHIHMTLEEEQVPEAEGSSPEEVTRFLHRILAAQAAPEEHPIPEPPLSPEPPPSLPPPWSNRWALAGVGLAVAIGLTLALWFRSPETPKPEGAVRESALTAQEESFPFAVTQTDSPPAVAYPMPATPFKEQKRPPCIPLTEEEIRGGCWTPHKRDAPCPPGTAELEGHCYLPVKKKDPEPTAITPKR